MSDAVAELIAQGKPSLKRFPDGTPDPRNFPPGTLGVVASDLGRYSAFTMSITTMYALMSITGCKLTYTRSVDVSGNCNEIIRHMEGDWAWIIGDDHEFHPSVLLNLLAHMYERDLDVIVPHCLKRTPPWPSVVYSHQEDGWYVPASLPAKGLTKIHAAGSAGMLIRRRVFDALSDPWFRPAPDAAGLNEDLYFCQQVREAGCDIWCDPETLLGHIAIYTTYPRLDPETGLWEVDLRFDEDNRFPVKRIAQAEKVKGAAA